MNYKFYKNGSYNIHTIKTEKFKNVRIEVIFRNNFQKEEVQLRKILFNILTQVNANYKTRRDLLIKCENLYDAYIYSTSNRIDGQILNYVCADFLNPKYIKEKNYLEDIVSLIFDLIFNPLLEENAFPKKNVLEQKNILKSNIKNSLNDPNRYSIREALKKAKKDAIFSYNPTIEEIDEIDSNKVYEMYKNVLKHDYIDIFIIGDLDFDNVIDLINKYAKFTTIKTHSLLSSEKLKPKNVIKKKCEKKDFIQSHLVYVLSVDKMNIFDQNYTTILYDNMLGGSGLDSILSKNLREENSLCYSVHSFYQKFDGLIVIHTSLDKKDIKLAKKLIEKSILELKHGIISEEKLDNVKKNTLSHMNLRQDDPEYIIDDYLIQYICNVEPFFKRIENYKSVTVQDIKRVANHIKINTIYVLENGEK